MSHTPEPWKYLPSTSESVWHLDPVNGLIGGGREAEANAARIVACVNGCVGLNPAAYRECVEALQRIADKVKPGFESDFAFAKQALANAQEPR